jgi:cation diffusion facilitator family transporter
LNLRSAYVHILADAATSVLAIVALGLGWAFGFNWLDPIMGILGAILIAVWSKKLIVDCGLILLDCEPEEVKSQQIKRALNAMSSDKELHVVDLHVWRVGKSAFTCAISIVTPQHHLTPQAIKSMLNELGEVVHSTVEVHHI